MPGMTNAEAHRLGERILFARPLQKERHLVCRFAYPNHHLENQLA